MTFGINRGGIALLALAAALFVAFMAKGAFVAPPPIDAASEFDARRATERLARILGDEAPHPVDSDANDAVRERLLAEIAAIGYAPDVRDDFSCRQLPRWSTVACARVRNIVFRAGPGAGKAILISSHYDSVAAGPGAADDGAGVAATLEIAAILKKRRPVEPVIFLITDGEEAGLLGAASFARKDPLAQDIAAVINMEARGVAGPALLFQTSDPNSRDIAAFAQRTDAPFGNSLAADIYKMLPNDTDMTEFLPLGPDAVNLAFSEGLALYHTPRDNLAHLDRRSLAHLGATALSALDGFLNLPAEVERAPERDVVYIDVFGQFMIVAPRFAALAMLIFGIFASVTAFFRLPGERPIRTAAAPAAGMAFAAALSFLSFALIAAVRREEAYWSAHPEFARAVIYLSSIAGGVFAVALAAGADRARLLCASWFAFSAVGVVAYLAAPGSALVTGVPAVLFGAAALASAGAPRLLAPLSLLGSLAALLLWGPMLHIAEIGLGIGAAWPFAIAGALLFLLLAPLVSTSERLATTIALAPCAALAAAILLALSAPAYAPSAPRPLNILHLVAGDQSVFSLSPRAEPPPKEMASAKFTRRPVEGIDGERLAATAPPHDGRAVGVEIISIVPRFERREISLKVAAQGADEVVLTAPEGSGLSEVGAGGETFVFDSRREATIRCVGRACADFELRLVVGAAPVDLTLYGVRNGLGPEGAAVRALRPDWAVPVHGGDARIVLSTKSI